MQGNQRIVETLSMNTKLIIVDGPSSVGKSSVSKSVCRQIGQEHDAYWLHEECENHPIRHQEFSFGALDTAEGMEQNRIGMLKKWAAFRDSINASGKVCVTEGCLLHAYDRYFIHSLWNQEDIDTYYSQVLEIIGELNPVIVLLYRPDLRKSMEKAFITRGKWWQDLILRKDDLRAAADMEEQVIQRRLQQDEGVSQMALTGRAPFDADQVVVLQHAVMGLEVGAREQTDDEPLAVLAVQERQFAGAGQVEIACHGLHSNRASPAPTAIAGGACGPSDAAPAHRAWRLR